MQDTVTFVLLPLTRKMSGNSAWDDVEKSVGVLQIAGGYNKHLVVKSPGGHSRVIEYFPPHVEKDAPATLTAADILSGFVLSDVGTDEQYTLPTVPALAAAINADNVARGGTKLQVGSSLLFTVAADGSGAVSVVLPGGSHGWDSGVIGNGSVPGLSSGLFRVRFTDVTVGSETASIYNVASGTIAA